jgi:hypothetical protein
MTLVELLAELGRAETLVRRDDSVLAVTVLDFAGRRVLAVERTYRDGIKVLLDPTPEEVEIARNGDLWSLWNSERARLLASAV